MERKMVRYPAVAGQFYPGTAEELRLYLESFCRTDVPKVKAKAVIVPHAGYIYILGRLLVRPIAGLKYRW